MTTPVSADPAIPADVSARSEDRADSLMMSGTRLSSGQRSGWRLLLMSVIWLGIFFGWWRYGRRHSRLLAPGDAA